MEHPQVQGEVFARRFEGGAPFPLCLLHHIFLGDSLLEHTLAEVRPVAMGRGLTAGINSSTSGGAEKKKRECGQGKVASGVCPNITKSPAEAVFLRTAARIVHENPL